MSNKQESLDLNDQYQFYLELIGMKESTMHPVQRVQVRHAFIAGCGQMLILLRDKVASLDVKEAVKAYSDLLQQVTNLVNPEAFAPSLPLLDPIGGCQKTGCSNPADFTVHYELRVDMSHPPAVSTPILRLCKEHVDISWDDVFVEEGWKQICDAFERIGRIRPVKKYSGISIQPIKR